MKKKFHEISFYKDRLTRYFLHTTQHTWKIRSKKSEKLYLLKNCSSFKQSQDNFAVDIAGCSDISLKNEDEQFLDSYLLVMDFLFEFWFNTL